MLRVISGKYRHRLLDQPNEQTTRPTIDRVREAIFNSLRTNMENAIVLDLFAGSGAMGIEASSNNAMKVVAIEKDFQAYKVLQNNISKLNINNIETFRIDAIEYLNSIANIKFDYIFLDPPYLQFDLLNQALQIIVDKKLLKDLGLMVIETNDPSGIKLPKGLIIQKQKQYGKVHILYVANII